MLEMFFFGRDVHKKQSKLFFLITLLNFYQLI